MRVKLLLFTFLLLCIPLSFAGMNTDGIDDIGNNGEDYNVPDLSDISMVLSMQADIDTEASATMMSVVNAALSDTWFGLRIGPSQNLAIAARNTGFTEQEGTIDPDLNHHTVGGWWKDVNERFLYVDGVEDAEDNGNANFTTTVSTIAIGSWGDNTPSSFYDGTVHEFAYYSCQVTEELFATYHEAELKGMALQLAPGCLEAYYPLDDVEPGLSLNALGKVYTNWVSTGLDDNFDCDDGGNNTGCESTELIWSYH